MTIGERIKHRRIELGLSQDELSRKMGYKTRNAIYQFEQKDNMKLSLVEKFAKALDTTPSYLMGWDKIPKTATGHGFNVVEVHVENTPDQETLNNNMMKRAIRLYDLYLQAPPEIQAAVETLLKVSKSDS